MISKQNLVKIIFRVNISKMTYFALVALVAFESSQSFNHIEHKGHTVRWL